MRNSFLPAPRENTPLFLSGVNPDLQFVLRLSVVILTLSGSSPLLLSLTWGRFNTILITTICGCCFYHTFSASYLWSLLWRTPTFTWQLIWKARTPANWKKTNNKMNNSTFKIRINSSMYIFSPITFSYSACDSFKIQKQPADDPEKVYEAIRSTYYVQ